MTVEKLEPRAMLTVLEFTPVADGLVADRDWNGTFDSVVTSATTITDRWFQTSGIGQERGVFEFNLASLVLPATLVSAKLNLSMASMTSGATATFWGYAGDGAVSIADGAAAASAAGSAVVPGLGYQEFPLTTAVIQSLLGGFAAIRLQNSALGGGWISVDSLETPYGSPPKLVLEFLDPTIDVSITATAISEGGGATATTGTVTRTGDLSLPLTVVLASSDPSEATVPASVSVPANQASATFAIAAVDDAASDGPQTVTVTATASVQGIAPVGLDTTFGASGMASTALQAESTPPDVAVAVQPDGKFLVASEDSTTSDKWRVTRLNANGSVDTGFGTNGMVVTQLPLTMGTYPLPKKIVVQPDGKILVGGRFGNTAAAPLVRYNADGTLDTVFGNGGIASLASATGWINDLALRPDGKIVFVMGLSGVAYSLVAQFNSDGTTDSAFGAGGMQWFSLSTMNAQSVEVLPDGRILIAGSYYGPVKVARLQSSGELDTTFGAAGVRSVNLGSTYSYLCDMAIDGAGRIVVGGSTASSTANTYNLAAARLTADGALDPSFSDDGIAVADFSGFDDTATAVAVQPDGKVVLGGYSEPSDGATNLAWLRYNADGTLDAGFDGDGRYCYDAASSTSERIYGGVRQADGKLVGLARIGTAVYLARFHSGAFGMTGSDTLSVLDDEPPETIPPVVTARVPAPGSTVTTAAIHVDVTFSEAVQGVDATDLLLSGTAAGSAVKGTPTNSSGTTWRFPVSGLVNGTLTLSLAPDADDIQDLAGNDLAPLDWTYTVSLPVISTVFLADFEDSGGNYSADGFTYTADPDSANNLWHGTTHRSDSPTHSQYFGRETLWNYNTGARNGGNLLSPVVSLAGVSAPITLAFDYFLKTESDTSYDTAAVQLSTNGGSTWTTLIDRSTSLANTVAWTTISRDISSYAGTSLLIRFNFDTIDSGANTYEGWYVDDVTILGADPPPTVTTHLPADGAVLGSSAINVDVTFSEAVQGVDVSDLVLGGTAAATATKGTPTNTAGNTWRFPVSGLVSGTLTLTLAPDANDIEDSLGNDLAPARWSYTIELNRPPVAADGVQQTAEDASTAITLLATDADNDALTYTLLTPPAHGTLSGTAPNVVYQPDDDFHGADRFTFRANDGQADSNVATVSITVLPVADVAGRYLFYNNSAWDGANPAANALDYNAIAAAPPIAGHGHAGELDEPSKPLGKQALLPGQTATFANYSSYSKGLNGILVAFDDVADPGAITAADFQFRVGNDGLPDAWASAPPPAIRVELDVSHPAFAGHPDVVTLIWADEDPFTPPREAGAISNQWLQVTVLATPRTGLAATDVFYWGNQIGESGNAATDTNVDQNDEIGTRNHPHTVFNQATIFDPYDFNRDAKVDQNDEILARNQPASAFSRIRLLAPPSAASLQALAHDAVLRALEWAAVLSPPAKKPKPTAAVDEAMWYGEGE